MLRFVYPMVKLLRIVLAYCQVVLGCLHVKGRIRSETGRIVLVANLFNNIVVLRVSPCAFCSSCADSSRDRQHTLIFVIYLLLLLLLIIHMSNFRAIIDLQKRNL